MLSINAFRSNWHFGLLFFGLHLGLLGSLVIRSKYIPKILGVLLIIAGSGYLLTNVKPFLFPDIILIIGLLGGGSLILWLLVVGVNVQRWKAQASAGLPISELDQSKLKRQTF